MSVPPRPSLLTRLKQARIVQVLLVYLGAAWAVLQIADTLGSAMALLTWVSPATLVLLLLGLVVVVATAWVQSLASTTAAEEAGEIPTDWEVAPAEALATLRSGRLPHLTWGRAIVGGVVAVSVLFGSAGLYVLLAGGAGLLAPEEASASVAADGIAVVPFDVRGQDMEIWREGMVDLLANNLDGVGGFRTIDPRTVMARWNEEVGTGGVGDLAEALNVARATGARYAVVGSAVGLGDQVRLVGNVYDLDTGADVAQGRAEGPAEAVLTLADHLAARTIRSLLESTGREGAGDIRAESLTTESLPALRHFLAGERFYRRGNFAEAVRAYEQAVDQDPDFAIAVVRLSESYGWLEDHESETMLEYGARAVALADRLPPRHQVLVQAWEGLNAGTVDGLGLLEEAVQKYPDDPEAWFLLAETYLHVPGAALGTPEAAGRAIDRALALDPDFGPYLIHAADVAVMTGDRARAEVTLRRYEELTGHRRGMEHVALAIPLILGDSLEAATAVAQAAEAPPRVLEALTGTYGEHTDRFDRIEPIYFLLGEMFGESWDGVVVLARAAEGRLADAERLIAEGAVADETVGEYLGYVASTWGVDSAGEAVRRRMDDPARCGGDVLCLGFLAEALALAGSWARVDAAARAADREVEARRSAGEDVAEAERLRTAVRATEAFHRGRTEDAARSLEAVADWAHPVADVARLHLGDLALAEGRINEAERYYRGALMTFSRPAGLFGLARVAEARGDEGEATRRWRSFVTLTAGGDADRVPRIREGRAALARLTR